ncbi:GNAT family N-acetyltransferase [Bradyrhizobium sp. WD16]|uniref:GNAT family N-acetyltransferase n=1 Tax=Bradyrhizobium sp. WD16 TaxID=1521768 RepID=UPI0020A51C2C|nr:GNAT family N-acetyltransferase [Bradyrhizobium sp. WD16]UTD25862.1 GNAT family N-acetyltransferase [Bradyrhizobium sp. WD16]
MNFSISDLREQPAFFDIVADRIWSAWWRRNGVPRDDVIERLKENMAGPGLPVALVAHDGPRFIGTASVIVSDLDERPHYTPWVAAVWIEPPLRSRGLGAALVGAAARAAFALGGEMVHLCAAEARRGFYLRLGWELIEDGVGPLRLSVLRKQRPATASGRGGGASQAP